MTQRAVIVAANRTAIGILCGAISGLQASQLGALVIKHLLASSKLEPGLVDEVILGQVLTAGAGQNPARQAAIGAGLPNTSTAMTINRVCGSGLEAVALARQSILCGDARIIVAGGQESMSNSPHILRGSREGKKLGNWGLEDSVILDGLWDAFYDCHMGITAENIAQRFEISREMQDEFSTRSQEKAARAHTERRFSEEIIPLEVPQKKGPPVVLIAMNIRALAPVLKALASCVQPSQKTAP